MGRGGKGRTRKLPAPSWGGSGRGGRGKRGVFNHLGEYMDDRPILFSRKTSRKKIERSKTFRRAMTESERIIWNHLRAHRFRGLHFRRQTIIEPYIVDFYCHSVGLVVEIDGAVHEKQGGMDAERDEFLRGMGLYVVRFSNHQVLSNLGKVLDDLDAVCVELMTREELTPPQNGRGGKGCTRKLPSPPWGR